MSKSVLNQPHQDRIALGMLAAVAAFFMFTVMNVAAKLLAERHSVVEIAFYRNLVAIVPFLFIIYGLGRRDYLRLSKKPGLVVLRGFLGTVSLVGTFAAFSLMPMADTTILLFSSSLYIPVLGVLLLKEQVGIYRWLAVVIGFVGVLFMVRPSGQVYLLGISIALSIALLQAFMQILLRYIGKHEKPEAITFYFFLVSLLVTAVPMPFIFVQPTLAELPLLIGVGLSGAAAQFLLATAFSNAPASIVTVFNYSSIIWATLFGWLIWQDWPLPEVFVGAVVVVASNLLIIWRESRVRKITGERVRAKL
ncbi:MAG: DMT family transporter [Gammaproteobacteria bacterium]